MAGWDNGVAVPGGASYLAPFMNFSDLGNLGSAWQKGRQDNQQVGLNDQQKQLNDARIADEQRKAQIAQTFKGGLPIDPKTGQPDYAKAASMLAAAGDPNAVWNSADAIAMQSAGVLSPLLGGGGQPQPQGQPQGGQPTSVPAPPLKPAAGPQGDPGTGTIAAIVTDRLPNQDLVTGQTIAKIAQTMGVDPNVPLTPGQLRRAQGLLAKYAPADSKGSDGGAGTGSTFKDRFAGADGGSLPPSANAGSPAPKVSVTPQPAARPPSGGQPQPAPQPQQPPQAVQPQPQAPQPQPQQPQGGPITPQVPLPKGFTDPQQAILALRSEAARLAANPKAAGQVNALNDWATRIEGSLAPVKLGVNETIVDPRDSSRVLAQGPGAAAMGHSRETGATLDADAENYRQTGKLPPNMGRGIQGQQESNAIRTRAAEMELSEGGNPADWAPRWQSFATQAAGKRALETRAAGLSLAENEASSLIPRVREISGKIKRTDYPTLNSLILASQKGSGGQDVIKLGIAVESLVPVYARVLKPVGQVGQGDMARAHDILDKAWSDGQINAALDQMQVELKSARTALDKTMSESENRNKAKKEAGDTSGADKPTAKWTTLPNGVRIREVTQ